MVLNKWAPVAALLVAATMVGCGNKEETTKSSGGQQPRVEPNAPKQLPDVYSVEKIFSDATASKDACENTSKVDGEAPADLPESEKIINEKHGTYRLKEVRTYAAFSHAEKKVSVLDGTAKFDSNGEPTLMLNCLNEGVEKVEIATVELELPMAISRVDGAIERMTDLSLSINKETAAKVKAVSASRRSLRVMSESDARSYWNSFKKEDIRWIKRANNEIEVRMHIANTYDDKSPVQSLDQTVTAVYVYDGDGVIPSAQDRQWPASMQIESLGCKGATAESCAALGERTVVRLAEALATKEALKSKDGAMVCTPDKDHGNIVGDYRISAFNPALPVLKKDAKDRLEKFEMDLQVTLVSEGTEAKTVVLACKESRTYTPKEGEVDPTFGKDYGMINPRLFVEVLGGASNAKILSTVRK